MSELKPCPFCGGEVKLWETGTGVVNVIECKTCNVRFVFPWSKVGVDLKDAWNTRTKQKEQVKCIECEYLEFEPPYAVCSRAYKGIVSPEDSCEKGKRKCR